MADHEHVKVFIEGVTGIWASGVSRRGEDIGVLADFDDIGCVPAASAFSVVGVNRTVLEGGDGGLDEAGFIERVCVDEALDVVFVADGETSIDSGRGGAPVFVEFETTGPGFSGLAERCGGRVVAFACDAVVDGKFVDGFKHMLHVPFAWRAGCGAGACAGTSAAAEEGGDARGDAFVCLLRTDEVNVGVKPAGGDDAVFASHDICAIADDHVGIHVDHDIWIACFADADDDAVLDANVSFVDAGPVDY